MESSVITIIAAVSVIAFIMYIYDLPYSSLAGRPWTKWVRDKLRKSAYKLEAVFTARNFERASKQLGWRLLLALIITGLGYYIGSLGILGKKLAFFINVSEARLAELNTAIEQSNKQTLQQALRIENRISRDGNILINTLKQIYGLKIETQLVNVSPRQVNALNDKGQIVVTARMNGNFEKSTTSHAITTNIKNRGGAPSTNWPGVRDVRCQGQYCSGLLVRSPNMPPLESLQIFWIAWGQFSKPANDSQETYENVIPNETNQTP